MGFVFYLIGYLDCYPVRYPVDPGEPMSRVRGNGEGSVYRSMERRASGPVERWFAQVTIDGQKRRVMCETEAEAKRELRKLMAWVKSHDSDYTEGAAGR